MAYLHCEMCDWMQDDFWSWSYNPIRSLFRRVRDYGWPRMIDFDPPPHSYGRVHSWRVLLNEIGRILRRVCWQKYWTVDSWTKAVAKCHGFWPTCPRCGRNSLDID